MLNCGMKRKVKAFLILTGLIIALLTLRTVYNSMHNPLLSENTKTFDTRIVSAQKLFENNWLAIKNEYYDPTYNHQHWSRWKNHYQNKIKTPDDAKVAIETMLESLNDPYTRYMSQEEFQKQNESISSKISGIGVNIANDSGKIKIINVIEQTPAQYADLKSGDIIIAVNGQKVSGLSLAEVSNLVKGPVNTFVTLEILRGKENLTKQIIRKEISIKTVKSSVDKNIGYIQISSFISKTTPNEFIEALENTNNSEGLIIDLRANTGGLLANAVFIANLFINKGTLVSIVGRNGYRYDIEAQDTNVNISKPVIILVDGASASASEIFCGAMKDYKKAKVVGTKTYGKGLVQKIIPMPNKTGLNITIAKYLTPHGDDINKKGISPDIEVKFTQQDIEKQNDVQMNKAKEMLSQMIKVAR